MKVSIVIPVYNEADQLAACLESVAAQSTQPLEVIVVDNNSSDGTPNIAAAFPFVKLIKETRQGVVHARAKGFNAAKGDIIGRIDADTILPSNWVATVNQIFNRTDTDAVSGAADYYNVAASGMFNRIDLFFRRRLSQQLAGDNFLWGANMAIRRQAWIMVRSHLCSRANQHEDYDIAIHLQQLGGKVLFNEGLRAQVSSRRIDIGYFEFMKYVLVSPGTYAQHGIRARIHMYEVVAVCALGYLPARLLHRGYDPQLARFSWARLINGSGSLKRVDPSSFVA